MAKHVLIIGATLLDVKGKPSAGLDPGTANPGKVRSVRGGTARNVAENMARLGADVQLITAIGDDVMGTQLLAQTAETGVNLENSLTITNGNTGMYMALLEENGSLSVALVDVAVMQHISPNYLNRHRSLFRDAAMIMMDGSLTPQAMKTVVRLANKYQVPLCADPSSSRLAYKLRPYLPYLHLVVPNEVEGAELLQVDYRGFDPDASLTQAYRLVKLGVNHVVVTLSDFGLDYATEQERGYIPPAYSEKVDTTGTGDAVTAAIMFGMINNLPSIQCMRLGAAAGGLTLQTNDTVVPNLSLDMLFEHLVV